MTTTGIPPALLAFYEDHKHPWPTLQECTWPDIVELLTEHSFTSCAPCPGGSCKEKFTEAFSPGAPREKTARADKNVESVSLLVYDFDHLTYAELEAVCGRISNLESVLYSTHSHTRRGPDDCCVRVVFPLSRALKPHEFRHVRLKVIARYGFEWVRPGSSTKSGADPVAKDLSRLYFLPTAPEGRSVEAGHQEGALLDLDELLSDCPAFGRLHVVPDPPNVSMPIPASTVDMDALRGLLKNYKPRTESDEGGISKKELVRRVFHQEPLTRPEEENVRRKSCHRIAKILAYLLPATTPAEAVVELVRPSVSKMPVFDTDDETDSLAARFQKVTDSWNEGILERTTAFETERAAERVRAQKLRERFKFGSRRTAENSGEVSGASDELEDDEDEDSSTSAPPSDQLLTKEEVEEYLHYRVTKNGPVLMDFLANVIVILALRAEWHHSLRFNEITKNVELKDSPLEPWETKPAQVVTGVQAWLQENYETNFKFEVVERALIHVAKSNTYNPLQDYLNSVERDSRGRIDTFLETYCGATLTGIDDADITEYVRMVSRRWLVSAVARALSPGCKMDTVLILEGRTGIYKSTALKALAGPFFSDSKIVIGEKDAMQLAGTNWIHEIAELTAFHASETETQKAFFSSPVDQFRAPYDRVPDKYPRLACFVGSTNDERYMNDPTGNRRYWPVQSNRMFKIQELRRDRDLIWAEAVEVYKAGITCLKCQSLNVGTPGIWHEQYAHKRCEAHRWWFEDEENEALEKINLHRLRADFVDAIRDYILRLETKMRRESYTIFEIASDMLKVPSERVSAQAPAIGRALKVLGFTKGRTREGDTQVWRHVTPELLLKAPRKKTAFEEVAERSKAEAEAEAKAAKK